MKLALLTRSLDHGGAECQVVTLARELRSRGDDRRWDVLGFLNRLVRALRRERPDLLAGILPAEAA